MKYISNRKSKTLKQNTLNSVLLLTSIKMVFRVKIKVKKSKRKIKVKNKKMAVRVKEKVDLILYKKGEAITFEW